MRKRGFTLIELIIAISVILILSTLLVISAGKMRQQSKLSRVSSELSEIAISVTQYAQDNNFTYPADTSRSVPPGLEKYLAGGTWPTSVWKTGVFDWDNWKHPITNEQIYQISYRLCDLDDPESACKDPVLFPNFTRNSSIFYCILGPCIPHESEPTAPAYCVNCTPRKQNY